VEGEGGSSAQCPALVTNDATHHRLIDIRLPTQRLPQQTCRLDGGEARSAPNGLLEPLGIGLSTELGEDLRKELAKLSRRGERQARPGGFANQLGGELEGRAHHHDRLLARAQCGQHVAHAAQRHIVGQETMCVEQYEEGRVLDSRDGLQSGVQRALSLTTARQPPRDAPAHARALRTFRHPLEERQGPLLLEGLERHEPPAGSDQRPKLLGHRSAHSGSTVSRATSS
jgi:hypothetical protein